MISMSTMSTNTTTPQLTLYFDGKCPVCLKFADLLSGADRDGRLAFVDITDATFDPALLATDMDALNRALHGRRANGTMVIGIDAICAAYELVGLSWMTLPLRLPLVRTLAIPGYLGFARHRQLVSRLLGLRRTACEGGICRSTLW